MVATYPPSVPLTPACVEPPLRVQWARLVAEEPELASLEREVRALRRGRGYNQEAFYQREMKPWLRQLVGWGARNPKLRTSRAFEIAVRYLYDLLP